MSDPRSATYWAGMLGEWFMATPLAEASISSVPAEFVKYFGLMASFVLANYLMLKKTRAAGGGSADPVHLKTPIETRRTPTYADKLETAAAIAAVNERLGRLESKIAHDYREISTAGHSRAEALTDVINNVQKEIIKHIDDKMQSVYSRINNNDARIAHIEGRLKLPGNPKL